MILFICYNNNHFSTKYNLLFFIIFELLLPKYLHKFADIYMLLDDHRSLYNLH